MPIFDSGEGSKAPRHSTHEAAAGVRMSPGPFIGTVKNNVDPMRTGRVQVFIQELGGNPDDQSSWRTVQYASPFMGVTPPPSINGQADKRAAGQTFSGNPHSYGFWMAPPDLEVNVLCIFVNGDPFKGYWFACLPDWPNTHMVPGIGYSDKLAKPTVEYNGDNDPAAAIVDFWAKQKTEHTIIADQMRSQGIIDDSCRGPISSSMYRESPSYVYGFSTPGRKLSEQWVNCQGTQQPFDKKSKGRRGGHSLVMDDGDADGNNELMRLRTAQGHQIMMNDSCGFIHVINSTGTAWFELDYAGNINFYSEGDFNVKAKGMIKLDGEKGVNISSKSNISIYAMQGVKISSIAAVDLYAVGYVKVTSGSEVHLSGTKMHITGTVCTAILGGTHLDLFGKCLSLNSAKVTPASTASLGSAAQGMPSHEPWRGHRSCNSGSSTASMQALSMAGSVLGNVISNNFAQQQALQQQDTIQRQIIANGGVNYGGGNTGGGSPGPFINGNPGGSFTGQNGRLDPNLLTPIGNGHALQPEAAQQWITMREAAAADGVDLSRVTDSYRTYDSQVRLFDEKGQYGVIDPVTGKMGLAAVPGTSNHGWGTAIDGNFDPKAKAWLDQNSEKYGYKTIKGEDWHWEYNGKNVNPNFNKTNIGNASYVPPQQQQQPPQTIPAQSADLNKQIDDKQKKINELDPNDPNYDANKAQLEGDINKLNQQKANLDYGPPPLLPDRNLGDPDINPPPSRPPATVNPPGGVDANPPTQPNDTGLNRDIPLEPPVGPDLSNGPGVAPPQGGNIGSGGNQTPNVNFDPNTGVPVDGLGSPVIRGPDGQIADVPLPPSALDLEGINTRFAAESSDRGNGVAPPVSGSSGNPAGTSATPSNTNPSSPAGPNC